MSHFVHRLSPFSCLLGFALVACAAPVADEAVASSSEDLNGAPDLAVGIVAIRWVNGNAIKGRASWSQPLAQALAAGQTAVGSGWTYMTDGSIPDGFRVGLRRTGDPQFGLIATDFRITLQAMDNIHPGTQPGALGYSNWASSENGAVLPLAFATDGDFNRPAAYSIGIETRPWPADVPRWLASYRIGAMGCTKFNVSPGGYVA